LICLLVQRFCFDAFGSESWNTWRRQVVGETLWRFPACGSGPRCDFKYLPWRRWPDIAREKNQVWMFRNMPRKPRPGQTSWLRRRRKTTPVPTGTNGAGGRGSPLAMQGACSVTSFHRLPALSPTSRIFWSDVSSLREAGQRSRFHRIDSMPRAEQPSPKEEERKNPSALVPSRMFNENKRRKVRPVLGETGESRSREIVPMGCSPFFNRREVGGAPQHYEGRRRQNGTQSAGWTGSRFENSNGGFAS
jgi:hypothetical protein